jgi:1-acyl-sn-glycerol-3-phosphate acyltransferase
MSLVRAAWEYLVLALGGLLLAVFCATWGAIALLLYLVLPASTGRRIGRLGAMWGFRAYLGFMEALGAWRLDLSALDELRNAGPLIIAPNHPCLLDAVLVVSRLPNALCVMKRALVGNFLLGPAARLARYVPNDSLRRLLTRASEELHGGGQLLLFPEATRTTGGCIGPLTEAVGALSRHSGVPVQVVLIETDSAFLAKGRSVFARPSLPLAYRVRLGRRFEPPKDVRAFTDELQRCFMRELATPGAARADAQPVVVEEASRLRG